MASHYHSVLRQLVDGEKAELGHMSHLPVIRAGVDSGPTVSPVWAPAERRKLDSIEFLR